MPQLSRPLRWRTNAKKLPGKNGAALFDAVPDHTYSWDVLQDKVLGEKLACLEQFFAQFQKKDDDHRGNSMLYVALLRSTFDPLTGELRARPWRSGSRKV